MLFIAYLYHLNGTEMHLVDEEIYGNYTWIELEPLMPFWGSLPVAKGGFTTM